MKRYSFKLSWFVVGIIGVFVSAIVFLACLSDINDSTVGVFFSIGLLAMSVRCCFGVRNPECNSSICKNQHQLPSAISVVEILSSDIEEAPMQAGDIKCNQVNGVNAEVTNKILTSFEESLHSLDALKSDDFTSVLLTAADYQSFFLRMEIQIDENILCELLENKRSEEVILFLCNVLLFRNHKQLTNQAELINQISNKNYFIELISRENGIRENLLLWKEYFELLGYHYRDNEPIHSLVETGWATAIGLFDYEESYQSDEFHELLRLLESDSKYRELVSICFTSENTLIQELLLSLALSNNKFRLFHKILELIPYKLALSSPGLCALKIISKYRDSPWPATSLIVRSNKDRLVDKEGYLHIFFHKEYKVDSLAMLKYFEEKSDKLIKLNSCVPENLTENYEALFHISRMEDILFAIRFGANGYAIDDIPLSNYLELKMMRNGIENKSIDPTIDLSKLPSIVPYEYLSKQLQQILLADFCLWHGYPVKFYDIYRTQQELDVAYAKWKHRHKEQYAYYKALRSNVITEHPEFVHWKSEFLVFQILKKMYPDAIYQYRVEWLGSQSFDVFIPSLNIAVEYQGLQHYQPVDFFGGEDKYKANVIRDKRKRQLCKNNGVHLIEIRYDVPITADMLKELIRKAQVNT